MLKGKLPCLHKYSTFLNCFPYENKDEGWTGLFLLCLLFYRMKYFMTCQKEFAASHSILPIACASLSVRVWQIGSRGAVVTAMVSRVWGLGGGEWQYSGNHRTACQLRLITLPHKRDEIFVRVRHVEMTIARNSLSGYGWNVSEEGERRGNL
jgi:hypothetical protein